MRYVCEIESVEYIVEASTPEGAARIAAARATADDGARRRVTVNVAEANEADLPLIAGEDYEITVGPGE